MLVRGPSRRVGQPPDISLVSYSVSLILPLWPQTILILASHAWLGQLVASDTMTNWSVSIRIFAKAGFLSIYLSARRHSTNREGIRKEQPVAGGEGAKRRVSSRQPSKGGL